jgi:hypothetical protein
MAYSQAQRKTVRLKLPVQDGDLDELEIGTVVYLDGVVTAWFIPDERESTRKCLRKAQSYRTAWPS